MQMITSKLIVRLVGNQATNEWIKEPKTLCAREKHSHDSHDSHGEA